MHPAHDIVSRRGIISVAAAWAMTTTLGACGSDDDAIAVHDRSSSGSQAPGATSSADASDRPTRRTAVEVPLEPDAPARGVSPTSPSGEGIEAQGLTLIVPEGALVSPYTDELGAPATEIRIAGDSRYFPRVAVEHVKSFGRSLLEQTYTQEVLLSGQGKTHVLRSRETWPGVSEAYLLTWADDFIEKDGASFPADALAFVLSDGSPDGGWIIYGAAPRGELTSSSPAWQTVFSAALP